MVLATTSLSPASTTIAQEAAASAKPASAATAADQRDLYLDMPYRLGGYETEVEMTRGVEHFAGLDPERLEDAQTRAELEELVDAAGADIESLVSGYALVSQDDLFGFVVALRIAGAEPETMVGVYLPNLYDDLVDPAVSSAVIGGKDVVVVESLGAEDEYVELFIYDEGDTIWLVQGPDDVVETALAGLPDPR